MDEIIKQIDIEVERCEKQIEKFPASEEVLMSRIQGLLYVRRLMDDIDG